MFGNELKNGLGDNLKKCLEYNNVSAKLLETYNDNFDFVELSKLAVDYSDGVVEAARGINPDILNHVENSGLPLLRYSEGDDLAERYDEFYDRIFDTED